MRPAFTSLAIALAASVAAGAEAAWPTSSASEFSTFVTLQRFKIFADHCSAKVPQLKPEFDGLMKRLNSHIQGISTELSSSGMFGDMKLKPVPAEISFAFKDSLDDAKHNVERQEDSICAKTLQNLGERDAESLKSDLTQTFVAVQTMIRNMEKQSAR